MFLLLLIHSTLAFSENGLSWWNTEYNTTEGTDFYVTFMRNAGANEQDTLNLKFYIYGAARQEAHVTITNPQTGWTLSSPLTIPAGSQAFVEVPLVQAYMEEPKKVKQRGLYVHADVPISLYATNHKDGFYDATNILPLSALDKEYVVQTYMTDVDVTEFAIVATQNGQTVDIGIREPIFICDSILNYKLIYTDTIFKDTTIYMSQGESFLYRSSAPCASLSGTKICSNAPIAVFHGGQNAEIPTYYPSNNHLYSQAFPTKLWGRHFYVTPTKGQHYDFVRITAAEDNTIIWRDGVQKTVLQKRETFQDTLESNVSSGYTPTIAYYQTSHAVECYLYAAGSTVQNIPDVRYQLGAPVMTPIIPQEQGMNSVVFATFSQHSYITHYVNIVVPTAQAQHTYLDDTNIGSLFSPIPSAPAYSYALYQLPAAKAYRITNKYAPFTARVYGLGLKGARCE
ncbi:MAG: IgGFc-binding protein, partial [Paludibacteraceae bacterium]